MTTMRVRQEVRALNQQVAQARVTGASNASVAASEIQQTIDMANDLKDQIDRLDGRLGELEEV